MKKTFVWMMIVLLAFTAVACKPQQAAPAPATTAVAEETAMPQETASATEATQAPAEKEEKSEPLQIAALKGPTGMGLAYLMQDQTDAYQVELYDAPDAVTGKFISGEIDIAAVPVNLASVLYQKTKQNAVILAVNTLGVLYVVENGDTIQSMADLSGKTIYATGEGSTPEYVLRYLLEKNGVNDATITFVGEHAALAAMLASGEAAIGMLPEPNVSAVLLKNEQARVALNLSDEFEKVSGSQLVQGCYIANREFVEQHLEAVQKFLEDCAASVEQVNSNPEAAALIAQLGILPAEGIAKKAIPNCNIVCVTGEDMTKLVLPMLQVLFDANPASVGSSMPEQNIFFLP